MENKKAQQEIMGFVLIVTLVVIVLMVYLSISIRGGPEDDGNSGVENALDAIMKQTTECAIIYVPDYDNFEDLFKSAYQGYTCKNLGKSAEDYLDESAREILEAAFATEGNVKAYELQFFEQESGEGYLQIQKGTCSGTISSAQRTIASGSNRLIVRLKTCI